jgi:general secretion pathway protein H
LHSNGQDAGFTLIEVLVVIAILGLTAALVLSHGAPRSAGASQRAAAGEIVQSLRFARSRAIARGEPSTVLIDAPQHRLLLDGVGQSPLPGFLTLDLHPRNGPSLREAAFTFAPDGSATGGTILLGNPGERIRIAIDWLTGGIETSYVR